MNEERESASIFIATALVGPLLNDTQIACAFAELILCRLHGDAELEKQKPLTVTDYGTDWVVFGAHQEPGRLPHTGAWMIRFRKSDCCVKKVGHWEPREIPDEIKSFFPSDTQPR
jgi:hypothetical protein